MGLIETAAPFQGYEAVESHDTPYHSEITGSRQTDPDVDRRLVHRVVCAARHRLESGPGLRNGHEHVALAPRLHTVHPPPEPAARCRDRHLPTDAFGGSSAEEELLQLVSFPSARFLFQAPAPGRLSLTGPTLSFCLLFLCGYGAPPVCPTRNLSAFVAYFGLKWQGSPERLPSPFQKAHASDLYRASTHRRLSSPRNQLLGLELPGATAASRPPFFLFFVFFRYFNLLGDTSDAVRY